MKRLAAVVLAATLGGAPARATASDVPSFDGEKTSWHGFDRYDFLMDETDLSIKTHKAGADEGNAVKTQVKGKLRCVVVAPKQPAAGNPWSWRGYYFDHEPRPTADCSPEALALHAAVVGRQVQVLYRGTGQDHFRA